MYLPFQPPGRHTLTHTHDLSLIHILQCTPSGYARSGKTSRAKFRKQLNETTAHQRREIQLNVEYVAVSHSVPLIKSLTSLLETTTEE